MKLRADFVSNSSSASFIIKQDEGDVSLLVQKLAENFTNVDIPWDFEDKIEIRLRTKNKNYKAVWEKFKEEKCNYEPWYEDWKTHKRIPKDPEETSWDSIEVSLTNLLSLADDASIVKCIEEIEFESRDENSDECNRRLALLYKYFDAIGCNPDASDTERNFMDTDEESFYAKMNEAIKAKGKYTT